MRKRVDKDRTRPSGRAPGGTLYLGQLQGRLDHPGNRRSYLILQVEHICDLTVETIGPEVRAGFRFDQLRGDAHAAAGLAH